MVRILKPKIASKPPSGEGLVIVGCFAGEAPDGSRLPAELAAAAARAASRPTWRGTEGEVVWGSSPERPDRVLALHGLGRREDPESVRFGRWVERALSGALREGHRRVTLVVPAHPGTSGRAAAAYLLRRAALCGYRFDRYRAGEPKAPETAVSIVPPPGEDAVYRRARRIAEPVARAVVRARDLANTPPNVADPAWMASEARKLARRHGMKARVLGERELARRGMGGLLAVGGGSARPPRLVHLSWGTGERSVAVVGKGITFDTGGISIKPAKAMDEMKFDKCGACVALAVAQGVAELELPLRLDVYLPLAENMPDGEAYRPGDIVRCMNGKTVEVLNTDAEGRMVLADALALAAAAEPDDLIDFATLTGACVVALGHHGAGLFSADEGLAAELLEASEASRERLWRLPLWPEFRADMEGRHAEIKNSGGRWGGACTAAAFLSHFVDGAGRWAHIDIAGTAYVGSAESGPFGATGYGVALALTWLLKESGRL